MQISTLIGKQILSQGGEPLGYVTGAYLTNDLCALSCLAAADGEEEEFYLAAKSILACSDVIIARGTRLTAPTGVPVPMLRSAYTHRGGALGIVCDWTDAPCFVLSRGGAEVFVPATHVRADGTLLVYPDALPPKRSSRRTSSVPKKKPAPKTGPKPEPQPEQRAEPPAPAPAPAPPEPLYRGSLLGKRIKRSVFDRDGAPIALAGEKVTPEILSRARRKGKLLALTVNTLT